MVPPPVGHQVPGPVEVRLGHPRDPLRGDDVRHDPPHLRSARREGDPEETTAVEQTDVNQTGAAR
jgi:hypothetical protein